MHNRTRPLKWLKRVVIPWLYGLPVRTHKRTDVVLRDLVLLLQYELEVRSLVGHLATEVDGSLAHDATLRGATTLSELELQCEYAILLH
jgi:hypothetical protein